MKWEFLIYASALLLAAVVITCLYGAVKHWKAGFKFQALIYLIAGIAAGMGGYALFGERIAKLFQ